MKNKILFAVFALSIIILGFTTATFAKYDADEEDLVVYTPQEYYFESDLLTTDNESYTLQANTNNITVTLKNYIDQLNVSKVDISYVISIKKNNVEISDKTTTGTITTLEKNEQISFTNLTVGTYQVIATSTSPYEKTLSATFIIPALDENIEIAVTDESNVSAFELQIISNDYLGDITINWVEGLLPDITNPLMEDFSGTTHTISISNKNSSISLLFFKTNPSKIYSATISNNVITITQSN